MLAWVFLIARALAGDGSEADVLTYPLGAGDEIHVEIVGEPDMSGVFRVTADGRLDIPYAGAVAVRDMNVDQATRAVTDLLAQRVLQHPQVVLKVEQYASRKVEISGGVAKPDLYPLVKAHTRISEMLTTAGGLADVHAPVARIVREVAGATEVITVDLDALASGDTTQDRELLAGDRVYVPPVENVYVDGQVSKPGAIAFRDGMTLTQAIAQAGSVLGTARESGVYIMRNGEKLPVNLKRVLRGDEADITLLPSDRIYVPESVF